MAYLYPSIISFFEQRMATHSQVERCTRLPVKDEYVYELLRKDGKPRVIVFLSDAYSYGLPDYVSRPKIVGTNSFILIARPEAGFDAALVARAKNDKIGIGGIGKMMGAINYNRVYEYQTTNEKREKKLSHSRA